MLLGSSCPQGPLAKMSSCGATLHCGQIMKVRHKRWSRQRRALRMDRVSMYMRRALLAHAEHRNAEAERGCSLPLRDALVDSKIVGKTHGSRLASRG
ncbi:UNVERIFIED_CONTAM: hypothetical protein Sindi_0937000 [Sesamum indicum]